MKKTVKRFLAILFSFALLIGASPVADARLTAPFTLPALAEEDDPMQVIVDRCFSSTVKNAVDRDYLINLADIIFNRIEPQVVELLIDNMGQIQEAAESGKLSRNIGVYFYNKTGDMDDPSHIVSDGVSSYKPMLNEDGVLTNIIRFDISYLIYGDVIGKQQLAIFDDEKMYRFMTHLVHELVHAIMLDYNRTGMLGIVSQELDEIIPVDQAAIILSRNNSSSLLFPEWFKEGVASAFAGDYKYNVDILNNFSVDYDAEVHTFTAKSVYENYLMHDDYALSSGSFYGSYCTSIPAVLYLCALYMKKCTGLSPVREEYGKKVVDGIALRSYLSAILERMHKGETLDDVIVDISDGVYRTAEEYAERFIKGTADTLRIEDPDHDIYSGMDIGSAQFTADLLGYLERLNEENGEVVCGSILNEFDINVYDSIYMDEESFSNFYRPTNSGICEPVMNAYIADGGKSDTANSMSAVDELFESIRIGTDEEWKKFDAVRFTAVGTKDAAEMIAELYYPQNIYNAAKLAEERVDHNAVLAYASLQNPVVADTFLRKEFSINYAPFFTSDDTEFSLILERVEEVPPTGTEPGVMAHFVGNDGKKYNLYNEISDEELVIWLPGSSYEGAAAPGQSLPMGDSGILRLLAACAAISAALLAASKKKKKGSEPSVT